MCDCDDEQFEEGGEPTPAWLLDPLTAGEFSNGMSKAGYTPLEAFGIEQCLSLLNGEAR